MPSSALSLGANVNITQSLISQRTRRTDLLNVEPESVLLLVRTEAIHGAPVLLVGVQKMWPERGEFNQPWLQTWTWQSPFKIVLCVV